MMASVAKAEELAPELLGALVEAKRVLGKRWKWELAMAWADGGYSRRGLEHVAGLLQSIRNAPWGGPEFLDAVKLA